MSMCLCPPLWGGCPKGAGESSTISPTKMQYGKLCCTSSVTAYAVPPSPKGKGFSPPYHGK